MNKKIAMAQIEIKTGDIKGNVDNIKNNIVVAGEALCDVIVFPEMTVSGYNCGDLFEKSVFISDCQNGVNDICNFTKQYPNLIVIIGGPHYKNDFLYNAAFIIKGGVIIDRYYKQLLANDYHHEDRKYFKAGTHNKTFYIDGLRFGIIICEDGWTENGYDRDIVHELNSEGVDIIFSLNYSYFTYNKKNVRENVFKFKYGCPIVYVNCVGVGDITKNFIAYDGNSFYTNGYNKLTYIPNANFIESFYVVNLENKMLIPYQESTKKDLAYMDNDKFENIYPAILHSHRRIFEQCGIKKTQVHISGGIDSAVVGYFAVKSVGKENVVFITQPSKNNGSRTLNNAETLARNLEVELEYDPIIDYIETYKIKNPYASKAQIASFEATLRKSLGFSYTHKNKSGIVACGNHTENVLGFFGFGDIGSMGVYQPIGDLTKTEIYALARYINEEVEKREVIPACLYDGSMKPAAELEDNNEDPFDYEIMSVICEKIIRQGETPNQIIDELTRTRNYRNYTTDEIKDNVNKAWVLSKRSVFKRAQSAPVLILSNRSIGFSSRETIINHYK